MIESLATWFELKFQPLSSTQRSGLYHLSQSSTLLITWLYFLTGPTHILSHLVCISYLGTHPFIIINSSNLMVSSWITETLLLHRKLPGFRVSLLGSKDKSQQSSLLSKATEQIQACSHFGNEWVWLRAHLILKMI